MATLRFNGWTTSALWWIRSIRLPPFSPNRASNSEDEPRSKETDDTLARLSKHGAQVVDEVVQYEDVYRLCYVRGPEGILIGPAEQAG